jgi:hypothetical protein
VGAANVTNIGFHDSDYDPLDDWQVTLQDGVLTWQTDTQEGNPNANALIYDNLYNFRFDADVAPGDVAATIEMFKPHTPRQLDLGTKGPSPSAAVLPAGGPGAIRLEPPRPNPLSPETAIRFSLDTARSATLEVFDPQGRRVRSLLDGPQAAGAHEADWDGADNNGRRLSSGVYYVRLRAGNKELVRSVTIVQ